MVGNSVKELDGGFVSALNLYVDNEIDLNKDKMPNIF